MAKTDCYPIREPLLYNEQLKIMYNKDLIRDPLPHKKNKQEINWYYEQYAPDINQYGLI